MTTTTSADAGTQMVTYSELPCPLRDTRMLIDTTSQPSTICVNANTQITANTADTIMQMSQNSLIHIVTSPLPHPLQCCHITTADVCTAPISTTNIVDNNDDKLPPTSETAPSISKTMANSTELTYRPLARPPGPLSAP